jgi:Flp pilus assembly protein TadG
MRTDSFRREQSGQTLVIVALMITVLLGFTGLVTDVAWYEVNLMRIQRAADAAALAGVVYLPNNVAGAQLAASQEASKNGFTDNGTTVRVIATPEALNNRILGVTVTAPVRSWFARLFGITQFTARRNARAEFVLPVPMGSPQDYYGINVVCRNTDTSPNCPRVNSATGAGTLVPLGFFGGVEARGTERQNGDAYSTYYNGRPTLNTGFDPNGYQYIVEFAPGTVGGSVYLYDPMFCATGAGTSGGRRLGAGDNWFTNGSTGITTVYNLFDMNGTPYTLGDDLLMATSGALFANSDAVDKGPLYRGDQNYGGGANGSGSSDCQASPFHNQWWLLASGLTEGQYRLQVTTSSGSLSEDAINAFGIQATATSGPSARVYGQSRMEAFIVINNTSVFYLAQIEAAHAGKTLEIKLFDPGDISDTIFKIRIPTAALPGYVYPTFSYSTTGSSCGAPTSGSGVTQLRTSDASGCRFYNNQWVTISVPIPSTYTAPVAPGDPPGSGGGWWKIEYGTLGTGQDITTWEVNIRGNPVHLITP